MKGSKRGREPWTRPGKEGKETRNEMMQKGKGWNEGIGVLREGREGFREAE